MRAELATYIEQVTQHLPAGNTFACLQALKHLLERLDPRLHVSAHFEQAGMPDLILYQGSIATGYVFIGDNPGGTAADILPNVLQTDYLAFHHRQKTARLGTLTNDGVTPQPHADSVDELLAAFTSASIEAVHVADKLAQQLGQLAAFLRDGLIACLDVNAPAGNLAAQSKVWQQATCWTTDQLATEYAQAIVFSLISAWLRHDGPARQGVFTLRDVSWDLPPTNPFMRDLLRSIEDDRLTWRIEALAAVLALADIAAIRREIGRRGRAKDPLGPLYHTFMRHFAPDLPVSQTAEALAIYLAEGTHYLLRKRFKYTFGLADDEVRIVDPATADGNALFFAIQRIITVLRRSEQLDGAWDTYAAEGLLPRLYGFNASLAAYALTHLKIDLQLDTIGYHFDNDQRLQVYLAGNTIEIPQDSPARFIRDEMQHVLPESTHLVAVLSAAAEGEFHLPLVRHVIEAARGGVAALALPADFADAPRHAPLRDEVLHFYSDLYFLQLPEMTVGLFARRVDWQRGAIGRVRYAAAPEVEWLATHTITSTPWLEIQPQEPAYRLIPTVNHPLQPVKMADVSWQLEEIMPGYTTGFSPDHMSMVASDHSLPILYRPFDLRHIAAPTSVSSLRHMLHGDNLLLCINGSTAFCASVIPHENVLGSATRIFPLYVYPETTRPVTDSPVASGMSGQQPNFDPQFILHLANRLDLFFLPGGRGDLDETFGPEDVFNVLYALLNSSNGDPKNLRFPKETRQFRYLARRGRDLARYHRLHRPHNWSFITGFHGSGHNRVQPGYPRYIELAGEPGGRIYINKDKFFAGIERRLWRAHAGGVQVLYDWLTARTGYLLGWKDLLYYQQMVVALSRSANTLDKINKRLLVTRVDSQ